MLLEQLVAETGIEKRRLIYYADTASKRYFSFTIKKHDGEDRWIRHPARPLKSLQRWLNSRFIARFRVHTNASAYQPGSSIRANALRHAPSRYTVRIDIKNFFPSFKKQGIAKFLQSKEMTDIALTRNDIDFFCKIVTRNDELTIGAPSSPFLTNAMMFEFDQEVSRFCDGKGLIYTRYADDIFISSLKANNLQEVEPFIRNRLKSFPYANLQINGKKTAYLSKKYRRTITGLVITSQNEVSIGRNRKRELHSLVHKFSIGQLDEEKASYLHGMLAFVSDVEPKFYSKLKAKYGGKVLDKIMR